MSNSKRNQAVYRLEYKKSKGSFHFEDYSHPWIEPNTFGWATIAEQVPDEDATRFTYIIDNLKIELGIDNNLSTDEVKRLWNVFSNSNVDAQSLTDEAEKYVASNAHLDLQSLVDKAQSLDPYRFE